MQDFWISIVAAVTTVVCNAIFFVAIRQSIDKRIEKYKIAYSGIFQEKLKFYKELLITIDELQEKVLKYGHGTDDRLPIDLMTDVNKFIRFNKYGSMFYPMEIKGIVDEIRVKFQDVIDASARYKTLSRSGSHERKDVEEYIEKLSGLTNSTEIHQLTTNLIHNIRTDFGLDPPPSPRTNG